ncbi:MAG: hypothetical protein JW728_04920 [Candidatus Aureabacteria bacterium]|nr:hypothetical protein [Candidatus Auribacterota bacterium]
MKRTLVFCSILFFCFSLNIFAEDESRFTYQGKPIHPGLVQEFESWYSDRGLPTTISVDISAPHSNEYNDSDVKVEDSGYVVCQDADSPEYFYYKWCGKLDNGLHVLITGSGGSGSGVFKNVCFVRFDNDTGYTAEGEKYNRLLMIIVRRHPLGDRDDGDVTLLPAENKVILGKSRYRDEQVVLEF